ncbi:DUF4147 domain-containing protein [Aquicoccus sp. SCR17]|nr:DUF4147 domain-containing protein [Carideicomes alvinocaridis]
MMDLSDARALLRDLFRAAIRAADPAEAMSRALDRDPLPRPDDGGRLILVAFGKAAPAMLRAAMERAKGPVTALAVTHHENDGSVPEGAELHRAGHPDPDEAGAAAAQRVCDLLAGAGAADRVVALISGGGSALLPAPAGDLTLADKVETNRLLLRSGLEIEQINLVRQQLSRLKGGGMLRLAAPAPVTAYILSDVVSDDLRAIASGPTAEPLGSPEEARDGLAKAGIWDELPEAVRHHLETLRPDSDPVPEAHNILIGSNRQSVAAMGLAVPEGLESFQREEPLTGDVVDAAEIIFRAAETVERGEAPVLLLFGGETTVKLRGEGTGGRNQELALRVALDGEERLGRNWAFLSGGTDGRDGPTDAAGGIVDAGTFERIDASGENAWALLDDNDSHAALQLSGDLLVTGATGTNVADVQALILWP